MRRPNAQLKRCVPQYSCTVDSRWWLFLAKRSRERDDSELWNVKNTFLCSYFRALRRLWRQAALLTAPSPRTLQHIRNRQKRRREISPRPSTSHHPVISIASSTEATCPFRPLAPSLGLVGLRIPSSSSLPFGLPTWLSSPRSDFLPFIICNRR